jgi:hypothetical protein
MKFIQIGKSILLKINWYLVTGYIALFQLGFIACYSAMYYIYHHDPVYFSTMPVPTLGFLPSLGIQLVSSTCLIYCGNKKLKGFVIQLPNITKYLD